MSDLTEDQFKDVLKNAGFDYYTIYGVFPDNIYIDVSRIMSLQHTKIAFMNMKPTGATLFQPEPATSVRMNVHTCHLLPISDPIFGIDPNDCYVKMPELPDDGYRSGAALARMAAPEGYCKK